VNKQVIKYYNK